MKIYHIRTLLRCVFACVAILYTGCAQVPSISHAAPYPLKVCLVSGNELGSMGDVVTEVYQGRQLRFCCKPCVKKFHANPEKYLAKLGELERVGAGQKKP